MTAKYLNWLVDLPLAIRVGFRWVQALEYASRREPTEALRVIDSVPERIQRQLHWAMLRLQQYSVAKDAGATAEAAIAYSSHRKQQIVG